MELDPQNQLALAALIVALVALVGTILQILAQYFATSEGYRKCGPSVIDEWARFTRRRFKFREFRFEIIFVTPHITCVQLRGSQNIGEIDPCLVSLDEPVHPPENEHSPTAVTRTRTEREKVTLKPSDPRDWILRLHANLVRLHGKVGCLLGEFSNHAETITVEDRLYSMHKSLVDAVSIRMGPEIENENASWVRLIQAMQYTLEERRYVLKTFDRPHRKTRVVPALRASFKSWDFMPSEIIRPCATTTVSSLATFIQILGLTWDHFSPEDGEFRASSENLQLLSYHIRALGTVVRFSTSPDFGRALMEFQSSVWSESFVTAQLGFGLIPERERPFSFRRLECQFCFRTEEDIRSVVDYICLHWGPLHKLPSLCFPHLPGYVNQLLGIGSGNFQVYSKYTAAQPAPGHSLIMKVLFKKIRKETHRHAEAALLWMSLIFRAICFHSVFVFDGPPNSVPLRYRDDHTIVYIE